MPDLSLETQGFFPGRGRGWRAWEDAFLQDFAAELGLRACAEQLRRPPADVALRISWLGIAMPADKVRLAPHGQAPKLEKKPSASSGSRAEAPEGWMTCAQVAKLAGCRVDRIYSAIWKKKLDALQGDRGVWLIPNDAAEAFVRTLKPKAETQTPEKASERPVEAKEDVPAVVLHEKSEDAPERRPEAENGHVPEKPVSEINPSLPLTVDPPAETGATLLGKKASPQAMDLSSMSKLDILRAIAEGKLEAANAG